MNYPKINLFALSAIFLLLIVASASAVLIIEGDWTEDTTSSATSTSTECKPVITSIDISGTVATEPADGVMSATDWDSAVQANSTLNRIEFNKGKTIQIKFKPNEDDCTYSKYYFRLKDDSEAFYNLGYVETKGFVKEGEIIVSPKIFLNAGFTGPSETNKLNDFVGPISGEKSFTIHIAALYTKTGATTKGNTSSDAFSIILTSDYSPALSCKDSIAICLAQINKKLVDRFAN